MMLFRLRCLHRGQQGFTLIEAIAALVITGFIGLGASVMTGQVLVQTGVNSDYTTASQHTMNAIYWVSHDAQMSQTLTPSGASGFPLSLAWTEWDNSEHQVTYSLEDTRLMRAYSVDGGEPSYTVVAYYVNSVSENTTCEYAGGVLTLRVTNTVGQGASAISVTRMRDITPRPGL